jgi:protease-4
MTENGRTRIWLWVLVGGGAFVLFVMAIFSFVLLVMRGSGQNAGLHAFGDKIGVVDLDGVILDPNQMVEDLRKFEEDDSVKAIIIHVNSPGGGVAASEEIYREVKRIHDKKSKPIISSIQTVGASGAYYVSSATNKIYADSGSVVGSIGVIAEWVNYGDLMRWAKLKPEVLKVGQFKDTGDPTRELTPAERQYMQGLIDNMYGQFVQAVADGRHAKVDEIKGIADGRVWTGEQAMGIHLVDEIADFRTAVLETAKSVGISGEPQVVRPEHPHRSLFDLVFGDATPVIPTKEKLLDEQVGFYYLWK